MLKHLIKELSTAVNPQRAEISKRFFKTGKGQYGEGDIFIGLTVPQSRIIAKKYSLLSLSEIKQLLQDKIHEKRLIALFILIEQFQKLKDPRKEKQIKQKQIIDFYLENTKYINNWDLVDCSAYQLLGTYLLDNDRSLLYHLARSTILWEKRIAIITTFAFIKNNQFQDTFAIAEILLKDDHDLLQKAVGWMLREVGKKNQGAEEQFLKKHYKQMPRTMLRYAIERFDKQKKEFYMKKRSELGNTNFPINL